MCVGSQLGHGLSTARGRTPHELRSPAAAGNTLRQLVFDPIMEGRLFPAAAATAGQQGHHQQQHPQRPGAVRQALGTTASFATSGLVHECIFWWVLCRRSGWVCSKQLESCAAPIRPP